MCDSVGPEKAYNEAKTMAGQQLKSRESHTLYELKQKREYLYAQLSIIQKAIEAVNLADNF